MSRIHERHGQHHLCFLHLRHTDLRGVIQRQRKDARWGAQQERMECSGL